MQKAIDQGEPRASVVQAKRCWNVGDRKGALEYYLKAAEFCEPYAMGAVGSAFWEDPEHEMQGLMFLVRGWSFGLAGAGIAESSLKLKVVQAVKCLRDGRFDDHTLQTLKNK